MRRWLCVVCEAGAVVTLDSLAGWCQPACQACAELARALALPTIEAKRDWENSRTHTRVRSAQ